MNLSHHDSNALRRDEQLGSGVGIATVVAVGVGILAQQMSGGERAFQAIPLAWAAYGIYLAVFTAQAIAERSGRAWRPEVVVALLFVSGIVVRLSAPAFDWTSVLFIVTAVAAAFELKPGVVAAIIAAQTVVTGVAAAIAWEGVFPVALITALYLAFQMFAVVVVRMATRQAEARRQLAATNAELAAATALLAQSSRNAERLRIARELHDVVGHQLTALALELEIAGHKEDDSVAGHVDRARLLAKDLLGDIRQVVSALREDPQGGLDEALRPILAGLPGLAVQVDISEDRPTDESHALAVVRLVQEAATNTLRHAGASNLTVRVVSTDDGVSVEVLDDGKGTNSLQVGNGLLGMRERIAQFGGTVSFNSEPGHGFEVRAWLPVA